MPIAKSPISNRQFLSTRSIQDNMRGFTCAGCDGDKASGFPLCRPCFNSLPGHMKRNLSRQLGRGYEEAFRVAWRWLLNDRAEAQQGVGA
jgi:hypothetical protein